MSMTDIYDEKFREVFEETVDFLEERRANNPSFTLESLENYLKNLYVQQGNDWDGRGELFNAVQSATIAAHESVMLRWKKEAEAAVNAPLYPESS